MGTEETKLAVVAIVVEREESVCELNELLHGCSNYITGWVFRTENAEYR